MKKGIRKEIDSEKLSNAIEGKPIHYPSILSLDEGDLKCIKNWKVGDEYQVFLTVKMVSSSVDGMNSPFNDADKDEVHARFEVIEAEEVTDENESEEEKE